MAVSEPVTVPAQLGGSISGGTGVEKSFAKAPGACASRTIEDAEI